VRQGQRDRLDAVLREHRPGSRTQDCTGRTIGIARDRKIRRLDLAQRGFARKKLDAGFLGCEARGKACGTSGAIAAVGKFLRSKVSMQVSGRSFGEQAFDARDLDRVDAAACRVAGNCRGDFVHAASGLP